MKAKDLIPGKVYNANGSSRGGVQPVVFVRMGEAKTRKSFVHGTVKSPARAICRHVWIDEPVIGVPSGVEGVTLGAEKEFALSVLSELSDSLEARRNYVRASRDAMDARKAEQKALAERRFVAAQRLGATLPLGVTFTFDREGRVVLDPDAVGWICDRLDRLAETENPLWIGREA